MLDNHPYTETVYGKVPAEIWASYRAKSADLTEDGEQITDIQVTRWEETRQ
jgi:hypothetical protein